jgi:superfamily II DNA or RNA helicase
MSNDEEKIIEGANYAFIDKKIRCSTTNIPSLIYNDYQNGHKVKSSLIEELSRCDEFLFSVAFITEGGLTNLLLALKEAEKRNVKGKIITTDYMLFSEPRALSRIVSNFPNIKLKIYKVKNGMEDGFHTKGYIFRKGNNYDIIVGSSNITDKALSTNKEWNVKSVSTKDGQYIDEVLTNFNDLWNKSIDAAEYLETYKKLYDENKRREARVHAQEADQIEILKPNLMQVSFTKNLEKEIINGDKRTLLISATGTGKTYASGFALRDLGAKKVLYIAHRERILEQSRDSYLKIFGKNLKTAILNGRNKDYDGKDFIFTSIQTISKDKYLNSFSPDYFDYIVIDEVHKSGAPTYLKVIQYFKPKLYLGMTATPERTDGFDVYGLFDHNIAYEIRLEEALKDNLLCPFHYFGITDFREEGKEVDDDTVLSNFRFLTSDERVDYILKEANFYGYSGDRVKGLIFVSRKDEGEELSKKFNAKGLKTIFLSGDDTEEVRNKSIERLTSNCEDHLDYIITIDIFNEGIDIPEINQVLLLRPTQSPIIFVQQLGRGLRKYANKQYVVIIDFIGNYQNNFMIPMALSGDKGKDKDLIRRYVKEGTSIIPGCSSIAFDKISEKKIYDSLERANINVFSRIKAQYKLVYNRLGRVPNIFEFDEYSEINIPCVLESKNIDSYYDLLVKCDSNFKDCMDATQKKMLEFISKKLITGKRIYDVLLLKYLVKYGNSGFDDFLTDLKYVYKKNFSQDIANSVYNLLTNNFVLSVLAKNKYQDVSFVQHIGNRLGLSYVFEEKLKNNVFKNYLIDELDFAIKQYENKYIQSYKDTDLVLYKKYSYEEVQLLLNWAKNINGQNVGGYKYDIGTNTYPVFINYDKDPTISESIKYNDRFLSPSELTAISKSNRRIDSKDALLIENASKNNTRIFIFIRKNKKDINEAKFFYFLGEAHLNGKLVEDYSKEKGSFFEIPYKLDTPVEDPLYYYFTEVKFD